MTEAEFTSKIIHSLTETGGYEFKITKGKSIPFSDVQVHQSRNLNIVKHGTFRYKIPDAGYQNPFDVIVMNCEAAYVGLIFWKRGCRHYYLIDIDEWLDEEADSERRSITEERANEIGYKITI